MARIWAAEEFLEYLEDLEVREFLELLEFDLVLERVEVFFFVLSGLQYLGSA